MKLVIPESVLTTELGDEGVLLDLEAGEYFGLDATGMRIWKAIAEHGTREAALECLAKSYEVDSATLERDLTSFVRALSDRKLVVMQDDA